LASEKFERDTKSPRDSKYFLEFLGIDENKLGLKILMGMTK